MLVAAVVFIAIGWAGGFAHGLVVASAWGRARVREWWV